MEWIELGQEAQAVNSAETINQLAFTVIAGAYVLLFSIQLILWNRIEKVVTSIASLTITIAGSLPEMRTRMKAIEAQQDDFKIDIRELQFGQVRPNGNHRES